MIFPNTIHIFCRVVDNFGDIGVCWRLARQLAGEFEIHVTLWVDDLHTLKRLCPQADESRRRQEVGGVIVRSWPAHSDGFEPEDIPDVVIEAFACELPPGFVDAMARRAVSPAWINLEYLSAEVWVEGCHQLASPHPNLPLVKHFFFPGFTGRTGGLLLESGLFARREAFQRDPANALNFLRSFGVAVPPAATTISLFCYPHAPVDDLFRAFAADSSNPVLCLVPEGVAREAVGAFMQQEPRAGTSGASGGLVVQVLPFVDQDDYDRLLWSCDLNFVRGEDSFVRAQWAARPFVWQIYPQDEGAHEVKLAAFLERYLPMLDASEARLVESFWKAWNGMGAEPSDLTTKWKILRGFLPQLQRSGHEWARKLAANGSLADNLVGFIRALR